MKIDYPLRYKHFIGVKFIGGDAASGNRIKLDPRDFNELQDIWLQHIDDFIKAVRGNDSGIIEGCNVYVQQKQEPGAIEKNYEVVVTPGYVYVNAALIKIVLNHAVDIPRSIERTWEGFKRFYLVLIPEIREFAPTQLGEPGMSVMAGRTTSHRLELGFSLGLVDEIPATPPLNSPLFTDGLLSANSQEELARKHNIPWFVLLAEVRIRNIINGLDDIIIDTQNVSRLMVIKQIQDIATTALETINEHLKVYFVKYELAGDVNGTNAVFNFPEEFNVLPNSLSQMKVFVNGEEVTNYTVKKTYDTWLANPSFHNAYYIEFTTPPAAGAIITASYFVDQHPQYLSNFRFTEHLAAESTDHDNRYYTKAEETAWRELHNNAVESHPTHVTHNFFNDWLQAHTGNTTTDHDNVYTRIGHKHFINDTIELQSNLIELSQGIGYGNNDYYIVSQRIFDGINGINRTFPLSSSLLDNGQGYIKTVRADISHDAVQNPAVLDVIEPDVSFLQNAGAYSEPKQISMQYFNRCPTTVMQSDGEVWVFWAATNFVTNTSEIWFATYKPGDGFFSPATPTGLECHESSRICATVVSSPVPSINQRIALVWHYDGFIRYTYIDKGQTDWVSHVTTVPSSSGCFEPAIVWVNDNSTMGKLHLLYSKTINNKQLICRRIFEIDLVEVGSQTIISGQDYNSFQPIVMQDKTPAKRVWYGWIKEFENRNDLNYDNSNIFEATVCDKDTGAVYLPIFNVAGVNTLNRGSSIAWAPAATEIRLQYSQLLGNTFEIFYHMLNGNGTSIGGATQVAIGQNQATCVSTDRNSWVFYDYLGTIYYRVQKFGMGQVKWNKALKYLEFQYPPVNNSIIYVDIAVPIKSLNERVSVLESEQAHQEEELAVLVRNTIQSLGLHIPLERIASLKEKLVVEAEIETDNRKALYGYDQVFYDKFFVARDIDGLRPAKCSALVLKNGQPTAFETSGLVYDTMGKITNNTGQIIKFYSTVYHVANFFTNGQLRLEIHGDLACIQPRIASNYNVNPFDSSIAWVPIHSSSLGQDINLGSSPGFVDYNTFGIEITLLPGGYIYDWVLFLKQRIS